MFSQIAKSSLTIAVMVLASRILGALRLSLFATILGASGLADTLIASFKIINIIRRLFSENSFILSLLPPYQLAQKQDKCKDFIQDTMTWTLYLSIAVTCLGYIASFVIVPFMLYGFTPHLIQQTVNILHIMLAFIPFQFCVNALSAIMMAQNYVYASHIPPILLNILWIISVLFLPLSPLYKIAIGFTLSGVLYCVITWIHANQKTGFFIRPRIQIRNKSVSFSCIKRMFCGSGNACFASVQSATDILLASFMGGGMLSHLFYSEVLFQMVVTIGGIAIARSTLRGVSSHVEQGLAKANYRRSIELVWLFCLPASIGLFLLSDDICKFLFEYGAFLEQDTIQVSKFVKLFCLGIAPMALNSLTEAVLFSYNKTKMSMLLNGCLAGSNIVLSVIFVQFFGAIGIIAGTIISIWITFFLGLIVISKSLNYTPSYMPKWIFVLSALLMGSALWLARSQLADVISFPILFLLTCLSAFIYGCGVFIWIKKHLIIR